MFNAYFDTRNGYTVIRILAFINRVNPKVKTYCQLWFEEFEGPFIVPTVEYKVIWQEYWGWNTEGSQPHLVKCSNPLPGVVPLSVSLVEKKCDRATNNLKVIYNLPSSFTKKPFAVCTKHLDFIEDQTPQIVEWIEILSILGADQIFIYVINIHPNMMKTLQYYEAQGKVKVEMMTEPRGLPNRNESLTQWFQNELIPLNDCLYKHMYEYNFLVPLDIDEVIIPIREEDKNWKDLMIRTNEVEHKMYPSYKVSNVFFLSDNNHAGETQREVPKHMFFLQHVYRAVNFSLPGVGAKSFQSTDLVIAMHNHSPMICFEDPCDFVYISEQYAQLNHYRIGCENYPKSDCENFKKNTVRDVTLWKYKDEVIENVARSLRDLKVLKIKLSFIMISDC